MTWPGRRAIDGGIDEVPLTRPDGRPVAGRMWLCGKHAIAPDPAGAVDSVGGRAVVVCLNERGELADRYPDYVAWLGAAGDRAIWWPIPDLHARPVDETTAFVDGLVARLDAGDDLIIHCGAGIGRAGTTAVCVLIRLGHSAAGAERIVGESRPLAGPEAGAQRELVAAVAALAPSVRGEPAR